MAWKVIPAIVLWLGVLSLKGLEGAAKVEEGRDIILTSGKLTLTFQVVGKRLELKGLAEGLSPGKEWLAEFPAIGDLWRLDCLGPDGSVREIGSTEAGISGVRRFSDKVEFRWIAGSGTEAFVVTMRVRCPSGSPISYWFLKARIPNGWKIVRADFPILPNIKLDKGLKMAVPAGWGLEYRVKPGVRFEGTYPSILAAMQFASFYNRGRGLYIGAHDVRANHKTMSMSADDSAASFRFINWTEIPEKGGGTYRVPYEAAIGVFRGDYYEAAQVYREFALTAPWAKAGPVSKRAIPQWVKDTDLWLRPDGSPEDNVEITKQALEYFGVPTSLHWYRWHVIPYDTLYPEYFPPLPGFAEGVKALQEAGAHVMPYINGRLCDPNSKTWTEEGGEQWAARRENGEPYTEIYGSKVPLNVMCPYTPQWQKKIAGLVHRLMSEVGVDGVYIDQIGAAAPVTCFSAGHGHLPGGGRFWVDGYRKLLDRVRKDLPEGKMITTEENAECWLDQFDALLLVNTPTGEPAPIPLFPAVYSERTITFGFLYFPVDDLQRSLPFRAKMARAFVWGAQLGWIQPGVIMSPEHAREAEFLRNLARCRRFGHDFVLSGNFLGAVNVRGDNPRLKGTASGSFGGTYRIDLPAVLGSAWLSEEGKLGVLLANMSDEPHAVEVTLPLAAAGIRASKGFDIEVFGSEGVIASSHDTSATQWVEVGTRGAIVLMVDG
jgi:hypothetical protein